ncbi:PepSY-associated TM helix domain-containing protein [Methylocystis bryophila]|uniref:Peptidase n=1 Tax=Methylocystis bryophila TaxID=655015 RepID=A0A1W6MT77_9HYPH|nr:PepSY-associated TM helix domain-containing protein [Methylocystis bryophila]ARN80765.1 hypothetical protein B1812_06400 [Methylocystis bryophila]BDV40844.1 peptidase [Methylocystis bryophila]
MKTRGFFVWLHRWVGLLMAVFLIVVGLTGSLLAFNMELERVFAPQLFAAEPSHPTRLSLAELAERADALVPQGRVRYVQNTAPDQARIYFEPRVAPATGKPYELDFTEFFINPFTGEELGRRRSADLSQGLINLMPFIYDLHWRLALGGVGQLTLGVIALAWTLDCFVAFYLTLPQTTASFWRRWKPAWLVKRNAGFYRLNFDLHRAPGLWLWALLFVFAWSSVMMDMRRPVYEWVMGSLFDFTSRIDDYEALPKRAVLAPGLDWRAAEAVGQRLLSEQGSAKGFTVGQPLSLAYFKELNAYSYQERSSRDIVGELHTDGANVTFDADTGALLLLNLPSGQRLGNTIESWLYALHMGQVFGLPYRLFVCALGFVITMLSITGIYIWWRKRAARAGSGHSLAAERGSGDIPEVEASAGPSRREGGGTAYET